MNIKYAERFQYDMNNTVKRVNTTEGQVVPSGDTLRFDYFLKDHLGNVRVIFNEVGGILQETDYYPFGLEISRDGAMPQNARNGVNRSRFLGKETQVGSGYIDLQARFYDPTTGRFMQVDPATADQESYSTYQYGWNNPILKSDPNGTYPDRPGDDPFLIGRLATTAFYDTKHALYNTAFRLTGVPLRAGYNEENGRQVFDTKFSSPATDNSLTGQLKESVNAVADVTLVATAGSSPVNPGNLLARTSESQVIKALKAVASGAIKTIKEQASDIKSSLNAGKNSVTIKTTDGQTRFDLEGKAHAGVDTPHSQKYKNNVVDGEVKSITRESKKAEPMNQQDIRNVRKYLEKQQ